MKRFLHSIGLTLALVAILGVGKANALEPITIELLTMPFGTTSYAQDMALESFFKEIKSPITLLLKQIPGAMFASRYIYENTDKMREGKVPFAMTATSANIVPYMGKGLPPYQDYPTPDHVIMCATRVTLQPFVTFDPKIKTPADMVGKKVGIAERSRPNMSTLPNKPIFDRAYGGFDKVDWQYLGFANSKDAILNGSIDVHMSNVGCVVETAPDGSLYTTTGTPDPSMMEVISSGKPFYIVSEDPEVLKTFYDPNTDLVHVPVLMKAGTIPGQTEDAWVKAAFSVYAIDKGAPADVVEEIVYQMFTHKARLTDYYEGFSHLSGNPFPRGAELSQCHPGLFRAMKRLGLPLPEGVTVPE